MGGESEEPLEYSRGFGVIRQDGIDHSPSEEEEIRVLRRTGVRPLFPPEEGETGLKTAHDLTGAVSVRALKDAHFIDLIERRAEKQGEAPEILAIIVPGAPHEQRVKYGGGQIGVALLSRLAVIVSPGRHGIGARECREILGGARALLTSCQQQRQGNEQQTKQFFHAISYAGRRKKRDAEAERSKKEVPEGAGGASGECGEDGSSSQ